MARFAHYIRENKISEYPQQAIWFDTETDQIPVSEGVVKHVLKFGKACYMRRHHNGKWTDEQWLRFITRSEFWEWVCAHQRSKTKLYLFCHNTSFDLPVLNVFRELPSLGYTLISAIIDAPPTILTFRNGSKSIVILDTLNFFRMPLKFLGEEIGLPKLEMPDNNDLNLDWETYSDRDVEIIKTAMLHWWDYLEREDMGSFAPTLAGQSMRVFRHKYMRHKIFIDSNEHALKLTREGYYGGRVEAFYIGKYSQPTYALDVNSMYPAVMAEYEYPTKLVAYTRYATVDDLHIWVARYCVTAKITLRTDKAFVPIRQNHKLIFPVGTFEAILSTPELLYAFENGDILDISEVAIYERAPLFCEMMTVECERKARYKRDGELVKEFITKKIVNSFYGKWGQSGGKWLEEYNIEDLTCKRWTEIDLETGRILQHRQLAGLVQRKEDFGESRESFPAIAAHVTAYARMKLWNIIETAGRENVYYCDTDCVLVNSTGREKLATYIDNYKLGALKLAGEYDNIEIWGAKDYRFGTKAKTKGVRKNAVWLNSHTVTQEQWSGLRGLIGIGEADAPVTKIVTKHLKRSYEKGIVTPSCSVLPFQLNPVCD